MISSNVSRRLEPLEERVAPPATRHVLRIVFVNTDGTVAPGGFTVDPWARREQDRGQDKTRTPMSPKSRGR